LISTQSLCSEQIQLLIDAAKADWRYVEPAIFGTLLERALDPRERHKLGAHFTPRAYVERLVMPTIINPLREQWSTVQVAAETWLQQGKADKAVNELQLFHHHLCEIRILDPACGSGNFLYVALEHLKRLEGEVLNMIADLNRGQIRLEAQGLTVDPHQFLGMEINPRAAAIAELVLWIGYLQWHYRIHGKLDLPEPILRDFHNIEHRDALLDYDGREVQLDSTGEPLTVWDRISYKISPITGELIPDDKQRIPIYDYTNPSAAKWPQADYIIGNPPYIGARTIKPALGGGYLEALRKTYASIPDNADFVMYWWDKAADATGAGNAKRFGLITTNSLRQSFCRKVVDASFSRNPNLRILYAVPDHPWVDSTDGAAVRVALITLDTNGKPGLLVKVIKENPGVDGEFQVELESQVGLITPNLTIGVDPGSAKELRATKGVSSVGYQLTGKGFVISEEQRRDFVARNPSAEKLIRPLMSGKDIMQKARELYAIDLYGLNTLDVESRYPVIYQWLIDRVQPERVLNTDRSSREFWWLFARTRPDFRPALLKLSEIIVTSLTAKHRVFVRVPADTICDSTTVMFALGDLARFGIQSSRVHLFWSFVAGGRLGVGNDSRYNKTRCFEAFPFPELTPAQSATITDLAERLDLLRKTQQAAHPKLTLTGIYNVLEKLRSNEVLSAKEQSIHEQGLVSVLRELHDNLDRAVFAAYGWDDLADKLVGLPGATTPLLDKPADQAEAEEELLMRLAALNSQRAAEEAQGHIRWLRPEYQAPDEKQTSAELLVADASAVPAVSATTKKQVWPKELREQINALLDLMQQGPSTAEQLASQFKRKPAKVVSQVLSALESLGRAHRVGEYWSLG